MRARLLSVFAAVAWSTLWGCGADDSDLVDDTRLDAAWSGGAATVFDASSEAYSHPIPGLSPEALALHLTGSRQFHAMHVTGKAKPNGDLGPLYNAVS